MTPDNGRAMTEAYDYYVRSPDGRAIFGFESTEAAETAARAYAEGAHVIDTLAQAYLPLLQEIRGGELVISGFGGWDSARDKHGGPALHWAVAGGLPETVKLLLDRGADPAVQDAEARGCDDIAVLLRQAGAAE